MRIFVYEYTCAAPGWKKLPMSLRAEGRAMLTAVLEDFARVPEVTTCTLLASDFPKALGREQRRSGRKEKIGFLALARAADYTLVIAPEGDDILAERVRWIREAGGRSLGCTLRGVELAADKLALAERWKSAGVPTPPTVPWSHPEEASGLPFPRVCKPRWGAGSQDLVLVHDANQEQTLRQQNWSAEMVLQPFIFGQPASVALLIGPKKCWPLVPTLQRLSNDGRFIYQGGSLPLPYHDARRAVALAERAVACVPGLRGYVGVDLILGTADDGREDHVIEINPRLTTSYIGLRQLAESNLAEAMLKVIQGEEPTIAWRTGQVHFSVDGSTSYDDR